MGAERTNDLSEFTAGSGDYRDCPVSVRWNGGYLQATVEALASQNRSPRRRPEAMIPN